MAIWTWPALVNPTPTPEIARNNPLGLIRGADRTGDRREQLAINSQVLFERLDGQGNGPFTLPSTAPSLQEFMNWHSFMQIEYLRANGQLTTVTDNGVDIDVRSLTIGTSTDPLENINMVLSQDGLRIIDLNRLTLTELAMLPLADQLALANLPLFHTVQADPLNLIPNSTTTAADATAVRAGLQAQIQAKIDAIEAVPNFQAGQQSVFDSDPQTWQTLYHYLFTGQFKILSDRLDTMAVFSPDAIGQAMKEIEDRFNRLQSYVSVTRPTATSVSGMYTHLNALDGLATIDNAVNILTGCEIQMFSLAKQAFTIADTGRYEGQVLDAPLMVFLLQTFENSSTEADAQAKSEEMNQLNRLLQDYTAMQKLLNDTLSSYDPVKLADPDTVEKLGIKGLSSGIISPNGSFTDSERLVISMFDSYLADEANNTLHPLEDEHGRLRPTESILLNGLTIQTYAKTVWDAMAINVSEATKVLNQDSQLRMDQISKLNSQKNRNYDLATNTLGKMTDILRSIIALD